MFIDFSISQARQCIMASPSNFRILSGTPSGLTDFLLLIFANLVLITIIFSPDLANFISGVLRSHEKSDA